MSVSPFHFKHKYTGSQRGIELRKTHETKRSVRYCIESPWPYEFISKLLASPIGSLLLQEDEHGKRRVCVGAWKETLPDRPQSYCINI